jgi:hypothetical protein
LAWPALRISSLAVRIAFAFSSLSLLLFEEF